MKRKTKPLKLNEDYIKVICDAIRIGCPWIVAAQVAGISRKTLYNWKSNQSKGPLNIRLRAEMKKAQAEFIQNNLKKIEAASKQNWQAGAWVLERRHPEWFAKINERTDLDELRNECSSKPRSSEAKSQKGKRSYMKRRLITPGQKVCT